MTGAAEVASEVPAEVILAEEVPRVMATRGSPMPTDLSAPASARRGFRPSASRVEAEEDLAETVEETGEVLEVRRVDLAETGEETEVDSAETEEGSAGTEVDSEEKGAWTGARLLLPLLPTVQAARALTS